VPCAPQFNVLLIAFFNWYYTFLQLEPKDLAEQLKRQVLSPLQSFPAAEGQLLLLWCFVATASGGSCVGGVSTSAFILYFCMCRAHPSQQCGPAAEQQSTSRTR
jgi:hypothetical protein